MRAKLGCPVVVRYASTESCLATGTRLDDSVETICTTVGRSNGGVELKIVDENESELADGGIGGVRLRSRATTRGYWNDEAATSDLIDADGWLRTGDLGAITPDGNLRLAGRTTEMYIRGGYNVYPIEIENCLGDHPRVAASAVLGVPVDDRLGEIGVVFVVSSDGEPVELDDVRTFVKGRLADYKAPDLVVAVEELPLTSIGKVDKLKLRPIAQEQAASWVR